MVCSQWLPQACWLELGACDETGASFPHTDAQKFHRHVRDSLHFNFAAFASALHAPDEVFGERTVLCIDDDVVGDPAVQVNGESIQDVRSQAPSLDQESEGCVRQIRLSSSSPCLNLFALATTFQEGASVNTTPTCPGADAHVSRAHITVHHSLIVPHSSNVVTSTLAQGKRDQCRAFLKHHCHLFVVSLSGVPFVRFPPVASPPTCCLSRPSASSTSLERTR